MTVNTIELEQPVLVVDTDAQPSASGQVLQETAAAVTASARKLVLAYVGAGAYMLDGATAIYRSGEQLLTSAEKRGAAMEQGARRRFGNLEEQAVHEIRKLQGQAEEGIQNLRESQNEEIEKRVELALMNMGLPSRERLERLSQEIDMLNQKLDEQIMRLPSEPIPDPLG